MREIGRHRRLRGQGRHRAGRHGGDSRRRVPSGQPGRGGAPARPAVASGGLSLSKQFFGSTVEPYTGKNTAVFRYTLRNRKGMKVQILTYGGTIQDIWVPGRNGRAADVMLGFKTLADYVKFNSPPVAPTTRRVLRRDRRPVRQPDRQGPVQPEPAGPGQGQLHPARQQRAERPARRDRRLRQPHLGRQAGRHQQRRRRAAHAGQPERRRGRRGRVPGLPERLHRLPRPGQGRADLHAEQPEPAGPALPRPPTSPRTSTRSST